jgi:ubiquinone/menaquinone biosynthesis C-methylase UbiE
MPHERDVAAFDKRAASYDSGSLGQLHRDICDRVADLALSLGPAPRRVLDVGAGPGYLLEVLAGRLPQAEELAGVDAAPAMVAVARERAAGPRLSFQPGTAEHLPAADGHYDLVVSTTSFDHWVDQRAGLAECARVLAPGGRLVLVDQFSGLLLPTTVGSRRGKARTKRRASRLLTEAGFGSLRWHTRYAVIIAAVTAEKPA